MNPDYSANEEDLNKEFNKNSTPWIRKVNILYTLAYLAGQSHDKDMELEYLTNGILLCETHGFKEELIEFNLTMGGILVNKYSHPVDALKYAAAAEALLPEVPTTTAEVADGWKTTQIFGLAYRRQDKHSESLSHWRSHLVFSDLMGGIQSRAYANEMLADALCYIGDLEEAKKYAEVARDLYIEEEMLNDVADVDGILARIMIAKDMFVPARNLLLEVRSVQRAVSGNSKVATKYWIGIACIGTGEYNLAERTLLQAKKSAFRNWQSNFKLGVKIAEALAQVYTFQGKLDEAAEMLAQAKAVASRIPTPKPTKARTKEINDLLMSNQPQIAQHVAGQLVEDQSEAGDISGRWEALFETVRCMVAQDDHQGIVNLWDQTSTSSLDLQDDVVLKMKNFVSHALYKVQRIEEALEINQEILNDSRLDYDLQQKAYAHENRARFLKAQKKNAESKKFLQIAIEENIEAGNYERALKISKKLNGK